MVSRFLVRGKGYRAVTLGGCWHDGGVRHFDLCIIGTGSGNSIIDERFDHLSVALVEMGTFGGTCLNVGCIPSKMFVHAADLAASTIQATRLGVDLDVPIERHETRRKTGERDCRGGRIAHAGSC